MFRNGKKGSIYEKIFKNNIHGKGSLFGLDVDLNHLVNEVKSALIGYAHDIESYGQYHCKVFDQIVEICKYSHSHTHT